MKILVTGGAGFIGSHTVDALIENGHDVSILDNLQTSTHPKGKPNYLNPQAKFIRGDVRHKTAWIDALAGVEAVYHLAAYQDYLTDFSTFFHTNAVSTALLYEVLLEKAFDRGIKKIIVAASQAVMGEGRYKCPKCFSISDSFIYPPIRPEAQLAKGQWEHRCPDCHGTLKWLPTDESISNPCNQYALSKSSQEQIAIQLGKRYNIPTVAMRYSIVQGPRQSLYNAYSGAMRIFALSLMTGKAPLIFEDGNQIRDYVNIEDVVAANLLVLNRHEADGHVFNIGGGRPISVNEFYSTMQSVVGKKKTPVKGKYYRFGDTRHIFSETKKLVSLGWKPIRDTSKSIEDYWKYIHQEREIGEVLDYAERRMKRLSVIRKVG